MSGFLGGGIGPTAIKRRSGLADPVPVLGAELIVNGGFDSDTWWTKATGWTISAGLANSNNGTDLYKLGLFTRYQWYQFAFDVVSVSAGSIAYLAMAHTPVFGSKNTPGSYWHIARTVSVDGSIYLHGGGTFIGSVDNVSAKPLTLASLFSTRAYASADCDISVAVTRTTGTQAGLAMRVDDPANPQNFILAYETGAGRVRIDKCVAGVYTNVVDAAITYVAGQNLRGVCAGNDVSVYYNGVQVGSTVTVSDAGIVSNTRHGKFSTYASNVLAGYVAA